MLSKQDKILMLSLAEKAQLRNLEAIKYHSCSDMYCRECRLQESMLTDVLKEGLLPEQTEDISKKYAEYLEKSGIIPLNGFDKFNPEAYSTYCVEGFKTTLKLN